MHGLGWRSDVGDIGFGKLSVGRHTLKLNTNYEFKLGDIQIEDVNESQEMTVEITSADTPDHLAAAVDEKLVAEVEAGDVVGEKTEAKEFTYSKPLGNSKLFRLRVAVARSPCQELDPRGRRRPIPYILRHPFRTVLNDA